MLKKIVTAVCVIAVVYCGGALADPLTDKDAAPPLPFRYIGKWTQEGRTTVFLARDQYAYAARLGENLDHEYLVDAIEENRVVLTYLPLGTQRVLSFAASLPPVAPDEVVGGVSPESVALTFSAPNQVAVEQDFLVGIRMQAAPELNASATVELAYDAAMLNPVEGASSSGRMLVRVTASGDDGEYKPAVVRFHVVTGVAAVTKIDITAQAADADGRALDVRGPDSHALRIIQ